MRLKLRQQISAATLASVYKLILGRGIERADIVKLDSASRKSLPALCDKLLNSEEFKQRIAVKNYAGLLEIVADHYFTTQKVETKVDDEGLLDKLMERTLRQWRAHGESDPVWSVTTLDEYRSDVMTQERLAAFYLSGSVGVRVIENFEKRTGARLRGGICLELGAGVGRCTEHLAPLFQKVIAVDISPGILEICNRRMKEKKLSNVETRLLTRPADITHFAPYDLFYSTAVLQHNAPPIQRLLLEHAIRGLNPSGFCLFQTPDRLQNYSFSAKEFVESPLWSHDMHCLPRASVLALFAEYGMKVLDVAPDTFSPEFGSYTYLAQL